MLDRAIGVLGLALALIFGLYSLAPPSWPKIPTWTTLTGIALGILLLGVAIGLVFGDQRNATSQEPVSGISLFLQFSDQHTTPKEIRQTNVRFWYALYTDSIYVQERDASDKVVGGFSVPPRWSVFVAFEAPARYRQMFAKCSGGHELKCDVQFADDRYAIITAVGDVTNATVDITTSP